jgi:uracil phosphoribosyltransferase
MEIHHLSASPSLLLHFLNEIRDPSIQHDRMRFRRNIERIGEVMSLEISKKLDFVQDAITTPLGVKHSEKLEDQVVICSILRAGLPLHIGFLNYFDQAENGFISAYRHHPTNDETFEIAVEYQAVPDITGKTLILVDPMLATGQSMVAVLDKLLQRHQPKKIHIAVVIAAPEGITHLQQQLPLNIDLWVGSIDDRLNGQKYIVPGLGDAGDLSFGPKL